MYTIDLLKGTGRPPGPQYVPMIIAIAAFAALFIAAVYGANQFVHNREAMTTNTQLLADLESQQQTQSLTEDFIQQTDRQRRDLRNRLAEINQVLGHEIQWSPILTSIAEILPQGVALYNISLKRESEGVTPKETTYHYSLVLGLLTGGDPSPVEDFMADLDKLEPLKPWLQTVHVANQSQMQIHDNEYLYIVIECRFDPPQKETSS